MPSVTGLSVYMRPPCCFITGIEPGRRPLRPCLSDRAGVRHVTIWHAANTARPDERAIGLYACSPRTM